MTRLQKKRSGFKGGITPFLSLIFLLLLSLAAAMFQSVLIQTTKSIKRAEMNLALENVFAEYNVELLKKYDIFAREGSTEREIAERLTFYGITHTEQKLEESLLLSDLGGDVFYKQVVGNTEDVAENEKTSVKNFEQTEGERIETQLGKLLESEDTELPKENNPIEIVKQIKSLGILSFVYPKQQEISNHTILLSNLPSHRVLERGINQGVASSTDVADKMKFAHYLMEHFSCMLKHSEEAPLIYEAEYLLGGKESDKENLTIVAEKILGIRMAVNYGYLLTDETKKMEAEAVALGLGGLLLAPEAVQIIKQAILLAWAYGESIVDVRVLFQGKRVPHGKTAATWQLTFANLSQLIEGEAVGEKDFAKGISYEEYLKTLLAMEEKDKLCMRALDLIELHTGIQVDQCLVGVTVKSECRLQHNITYTFRTEYLYR